MSHVCQLASCAKLIIFVSRRNKKWILDFFQASETNASLFYCKRSILISSTEIFQRTITMNFGFFYFIFFISNLLKKLIFQFMLEVEFTIQVHFLDQRCNWDEIHWIPSIWSWYIFMRLINVFVCFGFALYSLYSASIL